MTLQSRITIDFAGVFENILRVLPKTNNIAVVIGNSPIEKYWLGQVRDAVQPFTSHVAFTWFNDLSFDEMLNACRGPSATVRNLLWLAVGRCRRRLARRDVGVDQPSRGRQCTHVQLRRCVFWPRNCRWSPHLRLRYKPTSRKSPFVSCGRGPEHH